MKRVALFIALVSAFQAQARCVMDFQKVTTLSYSYHHFGSPAKQINSGTTLHVLLGQPVPFEERLILGYNLPQPNMQQWNPSTHSDTNAVLYSRNLVNQGGLPMGVRIGPHSGGWGESVARMDVAYDVTTGVSIKHNSYYPPQWVSGMPTKITVDDDTWCNAAYTQYTGSVLYRHKSTMSVGIGALGGYFPDTTTTLEYELQGTMTIPFSSTVSPSSIAFGNVSVGDTGVRALSVRTNAFPGAKHSISFVYTSDSGTQETLTVDNNRLPYIAKRTLPSNASSASDVFNIRIASSTAAGVTGRLQVTNQLD